MTEERFNIPPFPEKKKNEEEDILNNILNVPQIIKSFSIRKRDYNILLSFMEIAKRERQSFEEKSGFSSCLVKAMKEYIHHHPIPNPNCTLDRIFNTGMPARSINQCCVPGCNCKAKVLLTLRDIEAKTERFQVCEGHFKTRWTHPRFRWLECWRKLV